MRKSLLLASALTMASSGPAFAQVNQIYNPGFEMGPTRTNGNLFMPSNAQNAVGWMDGGGSSLNVVQVDGPGGYDYGNNGPENDKSGLATIAAPRRYLDIANGTNTVFQRFTPKCSGEAKFGGWFTNRAGYTGKGGVRIVKGSMVQGQPLTLPVVGSSNPVTINTPNTKFAPWVESSGTVGLTAGQTYSFLVDLDNNLNLDDAYLILPTCKTYPDLPDVPNPTWPADNPKGGGVITEELGPPLLIDATAFGLGNSDPQPVNPSETVDPCCAPWNATILGGSLIYHGSGAIGGNYVLEFDPAHTMGGHVSAIPALQAYLNYMNAVNPAINKLNIQVQVYDQGTNQWPINHPNANGSSYYAPGANGVAVGPVSGLTLTAGSTAVSKHVNYAATPKIFAGTSAPASSPTSFPLVVGKWYMVHTGIWTDREKFFGEKCANNDYYVRIQAMQKVGNGGGGFVLEVMDKDKKTIKRIPMKAGSPKN